MNNSVIIKNVEDSLKPLSEKTFDSLDELKTELSRLWSELSLKLSGSAVKLMKGVNVLNLGIVTDLVPDPQAFFLLRILKIAPRKKVYRFASDIVDEPLSSLFQIAESIDSDFKSRDELIKSLEEELKKIRTNKDVSLPPSDSDTVPISRLYRLASSYQRMLMHAYDLNDEIIASAIRKDTKAALRGQGMEIVEFDGTNDRFFNITEDDNCKDYLMTCPAIISKDGEKIIAKGNLFKHS
jgi:hypothetical protein